MKVLVLGGGGRTGRLVVDLALSRGHEVTALVRSVAGLEGVQHARLSVVGGSPCEVAPLLGVLPGHDAVVSTLGPRVPSRRASEVYVRSGDALVAAMAVAGVERVLVTSTTLLWRIVCQEDGPRPIPPGPIPRGSVRVADSGARTSDWPRAQVSAGL
ncbi:MAG: NAD(P)H-binding protein [Myxococcota bacterium]